MNIRASNVQSKGRVLVVDDEPRFRASYRRTLVKAGFDVVMASGSEAALKDAGRDQFDLFLVDFASGGIDPFIFLRRMREDRLTSPILLMVDAIDNDALVQANEAGPVHMLLKPVEPSLLRKAAAWAVRAQGLSRSTPIVAFRSRTQFISVSATEGKNEFGTILEQAIRGHPVVINKHEIPKAVLISVEEYSALSRQGEATINTLSAQFDALMADMQSTKARRAMNAAFKATPKQMGKAAVAHAGARHRPG